MISGERVSGRPWIGSGALTRLPPAIGEIAEYRIEAALALPARLVEHRECLQAPLPLVALRALRGRQRLVGLSPTLRRDRPAASLCGPAGGL